MVIKSQISGLNKIHTACGNLILKMKFKFINTLIKIKGYGFVELVEKYIIEG